MGTPRTDIELATPEFPLVGWHVMYRISRVAVTLEELVQLLDKHGFSAFTPQAPAPRVALQRAVAAWVDLQRATEETPDLDDVPTARKQLIREVPSPRNNPWLVFALVNEAADLAQLSLSYATQLRILLHKQHNLLVCTTTPRGIIQEPQARRRWRKNEEQPSREDFDAAVLREVGKEGMDLTQELRPLWAQYRTLIMSYEVSRIIRRIIASTQSVAVRGRGGVYFIPYQQLAVLQRLNRFIAELPTPTLPATSERRPFLYASGVIDWPGAKRQLAVALHAGIMDEVDASRKKLERFMAEDYGTVKPETMLERLAEFRAVHTKANAYADLVGLQQESIIASLKVLEAKAMQVVMQGDVVIDPESVASDMPTLKSVAPSTSSSLEPAPLVHDQETHDLLIDMLDE
jgi:hypothetical protein